MKQTETDIELPDWFTDLVDEIKRVTTEAITDPIMELSGGMQQRVALARALTFNPKVLLMDEPFGAVDEFTRNELNEQLIKIWNEIKVTIMLITHSINEAVYLADSVVVLSTRPAKVMEILDVSFKRPRKKELKESHEFQEIVTCLRKKLE